MPITRFDYNLPVVFGFLVFVFILYYLHYFIKAWRQTKERMFAYLIMVFLLYFFSPLIYAGMIFPLNENTARVFFIVHQITGAFSFLILILTLEVFENDTPFSYRQTILTFLLAIFIGALVTMQHLDYITFESSYLFYITPFSLTMIFNGLFRNIAGIWLALFLYRAYKSANSKDQKILIQLLIVGILLGQVFGGTLPFGLVEDEFGRFPEISIVRIAAFVNLIQGVGMIIIGYAFKKVGKKPWIMQRQTPLFLMVFSNTGINLFEYSFSEEISEEDLTLFSGGFSAISSVFQEATKLPIEMTSIEFSGKNLEIRRRPTFNVVLMVEYPTSATSYALNQFVEKFEQRFAEKINKFAGQVDVFNSADELIKQYFT